VHGRHGKVNAGLVIFDCDGVLVDSEPLSQRVLLEILTEAGHEQLPEAALSRFLGRSLDSVCAILRDEFDVELTAAHLKRMRDRLYGLFRRELRPIPGVSETIADLAVPCCVASSSQPERIRLALEVTNLLPLLEPHIFSATMVARGKPAPDLFLYAADQMGVSVNRCVVIEDSPAGIEAANFAGMRVLAFAGGTHARSAAHRGRLMEMCPDGVFDNMRALPEMLDRLPATPGIEP